MDKECIEKTKDVSKQIVLNWCKSVFEGESLEILKNMCKTCASNQMMKYVSIENLKKDIEDIEKIASSMVVPTIKEYIDENFKNFH